MLKEPTIKKEEQFSVENIKIIDFLVKCVNPILINGVLEIMKNTPEDPIDFLVNHIIIIFFSFSFILTDSNKILGRIYL